MLNICVYKNIYVHLQTTQLKYVWEIKIDISKHVKGIYICIYTLYICTNIYIYIICINRSFQYKYTYMNMYPIWSIIDAINTPQSPQSTHTFCCCGMSLCWLKSLMSWGVLKSIHFPDRLGFPCSMRMEQVPKIFSQMVVESWFTKQHNL